MFRKGRRSDQIPSQMKTMNDHVVFLKNWNLTAHKMGIEGT